MNKLLFGIIALVLIAGCTQGNPQTGYPVQAPTNEPAQTTPAPTPAVQKGTLKFSITDDPIPLSEEWDNLWVSVTSIDVKQGEQWRNVFSGSTSFDIFTLEGKKAQIWQKTIPVGQYTQVRIGLEDVTLVKDGENTAVPIPDLDGDTVLFQKSFTVQQGNTTEMVLDFNPYSIMVDGENYLVCTDMLALLSLSEYDLKVNADAEMVDEIEQEREEPKIVELVFPAEGNAGETITITWNVQGGTAGIVESTNIVWNFAGIKAVAQGNPETGITPASFSAEIQLPEGTNQTDVSFQATARVDGESVVSATNIIGVNAPSTSAPQTQNFAIDVDDTGFSPNSISVGAGNTVNITFTVLTQNVSFGGNEVKSTVFNTGKISPGASKSVSFTATDSFDAKAFWPGSSVLKGTLNITVE